MLKVVSGLALAAAMIGGYNFFTTDSEAEIQARIDANNAEIAAHLAEIKAIGSEIEAGLDARTAAIADVTLTSEQFSGVALDAFIACMMPIMTHISGDQYRVDPSLSAREINFHTEGCETFVTAAQ